MIRIIAFMLILFSPFSNASDVSFTDFFGVGSTASMASQNYNSQVDPFAPKYPNAALPPHNKWQVISFDASFGLKLGCDGFDFDAQIDAFLEKIEMLIENLIQNAPALAINYIIYASPTLYSLVTNLNEILSFDLDLGFLTCEGIRALAKEHQSSPNAILGTAESDCINDNGAKSPSCAGPASFIQSVNKEISSFKNDIDFAVSAIQYGIDQLNAKDVPGCGSIPSERKSKADMVATLFGNAELNPFACETVFKVMPIIYRCEKESLTCIDVPSDSKTIPEIYDELKAEIYENLLILMQNPDRTSMEIEQAWSYITGTSPYSQITPADAKALRDLYRNGNSESEALNFANQVADSEAKIFMEHLISGISTTVMTGIASSRVLTEKDIEVLKNKLEAIQIQRGAWANAGRNATDAANIWNRIHHTNNQAK